MLQGNGLWTTAKKVIWIPDEASDTQLRLCIIAQMGHAENRGQHVPLQALAKKYFWNTLRSDVHSFVKACIHCISTLGDEKVRQPFGISAHGTQPDDLLQFDYVEISPSRTGQNYILMLRDDHSDYKLLFSTPVTVAENVALAIIDWCAAFNVPKGLMSDGPTHFKNETIRLVTKGLRVPHHFILPYTPWGNGAVERLGKEVVRTFRALASELQVDFQEWPDLLPVIQSALNNAPSPSRNNVPQVTAFLGKEATPPISTFLRTATVSSITVTAIQQKPCINIAELKLKCTELHPVVQDALERNREHSRTRASRGQLANFSKGDFVLVAREEFFGCGKIALRWRGPRRIVQALSDYVYQVEDLRNVSVDENDASGLKFYHDASLGTEAIMFHVLSSQTGMPVVRLLKLVQDDEKRFIQVRWKCLSKSEYTFEPLARMYEDIPAMVLKLLRRKKTLSELAAKARKELRL